MAEFTELGKHCDVAYCNLLDFLPFDCDGCGKTFCKIHKATDNHQCTQHLKSEEHTEYHGVKGINCFLHGCSNRELTPIPCPKCKNCFCLKHRHAQDHQCKVLAAETLNKVSKTSEHVKDILASKQPFVKKPIKKGSKSAKTAAKVALMKMKMNAIGDKGIPDTEKIYFQVYLPLKTPTKTKNIFFSKKWSIGRVIDEIASSTGLTNTNNTGTEKKLRLFSGENGILLETDQLLETIIDNDKYEVYSGSTVIIEYVPATCGLIEDISLYTGAVS
ncbi:hypothetical protein SNE40_007971 [Patella caerulea]|uniref:AN1-type domain-containing protein n=1 Tax=Patella caerulea TaxID=87958 RepID=A0AAN8K4N8_PATCE